MGLLDLDLAADAEMIVEPLLEKRTEAIDNNASDTVSIGGEHVLTETPGKTSQITAELMQGIRQILDKNTEQVNARCVESKISMETEKQCNNREELNEFSEEQIEVLQSGDKRESIFQRRLENKENLLEDVPEFLKEVLKEREKTVTPKLVVSAEDVFKLLSGSSLVTEQQKISLVAGAPLGTLLAGEGDSLFEFMSECVYSTSDGYVLDSDLDYVYSSSNSNK